MFIKPINFAIEQAKSWAANRNTNILNTVVSALDQPIGVRPLAEIVANYAMERWEDSASVLYYLSKIYQKLYPKTELTPHQILDGFWRLPVNPHWRGALSAQQMKDQHGIEHPVMRIGVSILGTKFYGLVWTTSKKKRDINVWRSEQMQPDQPWTSSLEDYRFDQILCHSYIPLGITQFFPTQGQGPVSRQYYGACVVSKESTAILNFVHTNQWNKIPIGATKELGHDPSIEFSKMKALFHVISSGQNKYWIQSVEDWFVQGAQSSKLLFSSQKPQKFGFCFDPINGSNKTICDSSVQVLDH